MKLPEYITSAEVSNVCKEIGIRDWTKLKEPRATTKEAKIILDLINTKKMPIDVREFLAGPEIDKALESVVRQ